jgi:WD40 repeat protein
LTVKNSKSLFGVIFLFVAILFIPPQVNRGVTSELYWNLLDVGFPEAWKYTTGSPDIVVAIIDSGIDFTHPDLVNSSWKNSGEIANNGIDDDSNGYIDDVVGWDFQSNDADPSPPRPPALASKHGTFIAGLIAADDDNDLFVGIAPGVKLMNLRFLREDLSFKEEDWVKLVSSIDYAVNNGADVINLSLQANGIPPRAVKEAIERAYTSGVIIVGVTGNNRNYVTYPGNYSEVIAVSSITSSHQLSSTSAYGDQTEICAPGNEVYSITGYDTSIVTGSGTSFAAPIVSGIIALMLSLNPDLSIDTIRTILQETSTDLGVTGKDPLFGFGLINALFALQELIFDPLIYTLYGHTSHVWSIDIDHTDHLIASASTDFSIRLWDLATGQFIKNFTAHSSPVLSISFNPQGDILASGSIDNDIFLWNVTSGQLIGNLTSHQNSVTSLAFSPDGEILASASRDRSILLWNLTDQQVLYNLTGHLDSVESIVFSPTSALLASGSLDNTIKLWDINAGTLLNDLGNHSGGVVSVAFNPVGNMLISGSLDNSIILWNVENNTINKIMSGHNGSVLSVIFNPDGKTVASGSDDNTIIIWDVKKGQLMARLKAHNSSVVNLSYSTIGKILASCSTDYSIKIWNVTDIDFDGMPDQWERSYNLNPGYYKDKFSDADRDNLTNFQEYQFGTNPNLVDTDGDLMPDDYEYQNYLNGTYNDSFEDTDGDGIPNLYEYQNGLLAGVDDSSDDPDGDGLSNLQEFLHETNPWASDSDNDGWNDGIEIIWGTDPLLSNSNPFNLIITGLLIIFSLFGVVIIMFFQIRNRIEKSGQ